MVFSVSKYVTLFLLSLFPCKALIGSKVNVRSNNVRISELSWTPHFVSNRCNDGNPDFECDFVDHKNMRNIDNEPTIVHQSRRKLVVDAFRTTSAIFGAFTIIKSSSSPVHAQEDNIGQQRFVRTQKDFTYEFDPPPGFVQSNKPLKTHLDEVMFSKEGVRGYQYGITVDPVRISSLRAFGTPGEIAAKIVMAEVNRDGVFEVKLTNDPVENVETGWYEIDYVSTGKRGVKHFVTRTSIKDGKLFVLTVQVKEDEYLEKEKEILISVKSFKV